MEKVTQELVELCEEMLADLGARKAPTTILFKKRFMTINQALYKLRHPYIAPAVVAVQPERENSWFSGFMKILGKESI